MIADVLQRMRQEQTRLIDRLAVNMRERFELDIALAQITDEIDAMDLITNPSNVSLLKTTLLEKANGGKLEPAPGVGAGITEG